VDDKEDRKARIGTELRGKWTLERLLGEGGMAAVYVGLHRIGRRDAIKILHQSVAGDPELRARFEQEALAVNRFHHPGAVEIRDIDVTDDGAPFLVMELLEGESLASRAGRGPVPTAELLRWVDQLLDVLKSAHAEGIVHRDIKPDNLFLLPDGRLKVLDFGIARVRDGSFGKQMATRAGIALGTMSYMPPEQLSGIGVDHRADLFAVGATMLRLLTGRRIHEARNNSELLVRMATVPAPPVREASPQIDPDFAAVLDRALMFTKERRYPDADTMQADVRALLRGEKPLHTGEPALVATGLPTVATPSPVAATTANNAETRNYSVHSVPTKAEHAPDRADAAPPTVTAGPRGAVSPVTVGDATGVFAMDDVPGDAGDAAGSPGGAGSGAAMGEPTGGSPPPTTSFGAEPSGVLTTLPLGTPTPTPQQLVRAGLPISPAPPGVTGATNASTKANPGLDASPSVGAVSGHVPSPASLAPTMVAGAPSPVAVVSGSAPALRPASPVGGAPVAPVFAPALAGPDPHATQTSGASSPNGLLVLVIAGAAALGFFVVVLAILGMFLFRAAPSPAAAPAPTTTGLATATVEPPGGPAPTTPTTTTVPGLTKTTDRPPPDPGPPGLTKKKKK
jgi:eukaryotic-like serine/threonine-protein kinase